MENRKIYLICNAHLDPMWLWEWEEGAAEAISTFRTAAKLCREFDAFIFNHNEALLYQWVEEYEPSLFEEIKELVKLGKWKIIGGWYLQPDCNMPSGEGFVRQINYGNAYFMEKFGVKPETAVNFDSFGHNRGLVQVLNKCGYKNYLICRPTWLNAISLPDEFKWVGYDGSEVYVRRHFELYNSPLGRAEDKIRYLLDERKDNPLFILWGVGNHGGGPSRKDLDDIDKLIKEKEKENIKIKHSYPDEYFNEISKSNETVNVSLNPVNTGCYTSQILVKQAYRSIENELFKVEKMCSCATLKGLMEYPEELAQVEKDMIFLQFHDILPGSGIKPVQDKALKIADHGMEILSKLRMRAFFALSTQIGYKANGNYPVLVYNPHPYTTDDVIDCEFNMADQNWNDTFTEMEVYCNGERVPSQIEKEKCNLNLDWRKHVVFRAKLKPASMNLFECKPKVVPIPSKDRPIPDKLDMGKYTVSFDKKEGFINGLFINNKNLIKGNAFVPAVFSDTEDAWAMRPFQDERLGNFIGDFKLLSEDVGSEFSGVKNIIPSIRIIEDGEVRTVVECVLGYKQSKLIETYFLYKDMNRLDVNIKVFFMEKDKCLKLRIPYNFDGDFIGQQVFGKEKLRMNGGEAVFQNWCGIVGKESLYVMNKGTYGGSCENNELLLTLLRTPAFTGHPINDRDILKQDRYTDRMDLGEREFSFSLCFNENSEKVNTLATEFNQPAVTMSFFPNGKGESDSVIELSNEDIDLVAFKKSKQGYLIRLFNPLDKSVETQVKIALCGINESIKFGAYEVKTFRLIENRLIENNLSEN